MSGAGEHRKLGPLLATVLVAGNMIGSGIYLLPATLAAIGSSSVIGWVLAGIGALFLAGVFASLSRLRPGADGVVAYAGEGLGRFFGFQTGVLYWMSAWVGVVAIAVAMVAYLAFFFPVLAQPLPAALATTATIWLFTLLNLVGARAATRFGGLTLIAGLLPVLATAVLGWLWFDPELFAASWNVTGKPVASVVQASLASVFWAFTGLESAAIAAAVVRRPERNVPRATFGGVAAAAVIYVLASVAIMGVVPAAELARSTAPFALLVSHLPGVGAGAAAIVAVCALLKTAGTVSGWVLVNAETARASLDRDVAPGRFPSRPDRPPSRILIGLAMLMTAAVFATMSPTLGKQFGVLINVATDFCLAVYVLCCVALLRFSGELSSPRARLLARVSAVGGAAFSVWAIATSGREMIEITLGLAAVCLPIWLVLAGARRLRPAAA